MKKILAFLLLFVFISISTYATCNDGNDDDGDGLIDWEYDLGCYGPNDATETADGKYESGWSVFDKSSSAQVIYVSSSSGNDVNNGLTPQTAVKTIQKGYDLLRTGFSDWLLIKRGDSFTNGIPQWMKGGLSDSQPVIVASYGTGSRPKVSGKSTTCQTVFCSYDTKYVAVIGIEMDASGINNGIQSWPGTTTPGMRNFLFEDIHIHHALSKNIMFQWEATDTNVKDITFRRSLITHANGGTRPAGIWSKRVENLVFDECIFFANGPGGGGYDHNIYLSTPKNLVIRNTIFDTTGGAQMKLSGLEGGLVDNNLLLRGAWIGAIYPNSHPGIVDSLTFENNVGVNMNNGRFIRIWSNQNSVYKNNVFVNSQSMGSIFNMEDNTGVSFWASRMPSVNVEIDGNIIHNIGAGGSINLGGDKQGITVKNNILSDPNGQMRMTAIKTESFDQNDLTFQNNEYYTARPPASWFAEVGIDKSYSDWLALTGETGSSNTQPVFQDTTRDLLSYMTLIGETPSIDNFLNKRMAMGKGNWDSKFTAQEVNNYIREGFSTSCTNGQTRQCSKQQGVCQGKTQTCVNEQWTQCNYGPDYEITETSCDQKDNDCDGQTDEGVIKSYCPDADSDNYGNKNSISQGCSVPHSYITTCTDCNDNDANINPGKTEIMCDQIDQDCNGNDDVGTDNDNDGASASAGCGLIDCNDNDPQIFPGNTETCDGKDNDCNSQIDDNLIAPNANLQDGVCQGTKKICTSGTWAEPIYTSLSNYETSETLCDSLDNDCDATTDEGCACTEGQTQQCGTSEVGACQYGTQECSAGVWGTCQNSIDPATEICNNIDDDCDTTVDELLADCLTAEIPPPCQPNWKCTEWGECSDKRRKSRVCTDINECDILIGKPSISSACFGSTSKSSSSPSRTSSSPSSGTSSTPSWRKSTEELNTPESEKIILEENNSNSTFYYIIILLVVIAIAGFYFLKMGVKPSLKNTVQVRDLLRENILEMRKQGRSDDEVKTILKQQGFDDTQINQRLK